MRRSRKRDPEKFRERERIFSQNREKNTPQAIARIELNNALRSGSVVKPPNCEECRKFRKLCGHHEDYNKPLEVKWLCYECHGQRHWID